MTALKSFISPKVEVRDEGSIHGRGMFAKEDIKKGEIIMIKAGHVMPITDAMESERILGEFSIQISDMFSIAPKTVEDINDESIFINHSCSPNIGPFGQITFVALKDITSDEEICYDYAMTTSRYYRLVCNCGSDNCRKIVTGEDWKKKELQNKYGDHFSFYILQKIKKEKN